MPLEEDVAWCRSTASGSAPESEEEVGSGGCPGMGMKFWLVLCGLSMWMLGCPQHQKLLDR